jgi:4-hydroxy 2-oxovalerate aldolase
MSGTAKNMNNISLLDCTLRDGGYVNNWGFTSGQITSAIANLTNAGIDYVEAGYLTSIFSNVNGTQFGDMESVSRVLPKERNGTKYVVMADVAQFDAAALCKRTAETADGIRVVFYKRQIEQAYEFCKNIVSMGYDLFLQPMVSVDYSPKEFSELVSRFQKSYPLYSIAIVDSFGCMTETEVDSFVKILENDISEDVRIGFHGHNNMNLAMSNSIQFFKYTGRRQFVIDASASGIGRGAGNLPTELIANYYNLEHNGNYDLRAIMQVVNDVAEPISREHKWGYSPYFMLTAMRRAHPNFAAFLLENHFVSVSQFSEYLKIIPDNMLTKCTRPYVEELYARFLN